MAGITDVVEKKTSAATEPKVAKARKAPAKATAAPKAAKSEPRVAARPKSRPGAVETPAPEPAPPPPRASRPRADRHLGDLGRPGRHRSPGRRPGRGRGPPGPGDHRGQARGLERPDRPPALVGQLAAAPLADAREPDPAPWPDLWIAAGRATLPLSIRARRWSAGKTYVVQIQDPRVPAHMFDLVIPPKHDRLSGDNVLPITGSPHRVTAARLQSEYEAFKDRIDALPRPRVAVLLGGKSRAFDLSAVRAAEMAHQIQLPLEQEGGSLLMTFSRRTPEPAKALLTARLRHLPGIIWDGTGPNPYFAFLAAADYILVTEDSTNMATEAASTGKPVFILKMDGTSLKFRLFHQELEGMGAARPYGGAFHGWTYAPVDETGRAAAEVVARMDGRDRLDLPKAP